MFSPEYCAPDRIVAVRERDAIVEPEGDGAVVSFRALARRMSTANC